MPEIIQSVNNILDPKINSVVQEGKSGNLTKMRVFFKVYVWRPKILKMSKV